MPDKLLLYLQCKLTFLMLLGSMVVVGNNAYRWFHNDMANYPEDRVNPWLPLWLSAIIFVVCSVVYYNRRELYIHWFKFVVDGTVIDKHFDVYHYSSVRTLEVKGKTRSGKTNVYFNHVSDGTYQQYNVGDRIAFKK